VLRFLLALPKRLLPGVILYFTYCTRTYRATIVGIFMWRSRWPV